MIAEINEARNQYMMQHGNYPTEVWLGHLEYSALRKEINQPPLLYRNHPEGTDEMKVFGLSVKRSAEQNCFRIGTTMEFAISPSSEQHSSRLLIPAESP